MRVRDGEFELIDWDPRTGRTVWMTRDERGRPVIRHDLPVAATLEENAAVRNAATAGWSGDWHRIASLPMQLLYDRNLGLNEAVQQGDDKYVSRWLNSSDNRGWRTKEGNV